MSDSQRYHLNKGVLNIMEKGSTQPALPCNLYVHGLQTTLHWKRVFKGRLLIFLNVFFTIFVHQTVKESIFLMQMEYCLQSIYNHMVWRAGSILSPFYSILLDLNLYLSCKIPLFSFIKSVPLCLFPPMPRKHKYSSHI